jgi:hypothetical protein
MKIIGYDIRRSATLKYGEGNKLYVSIIIIIDVSHALEMKREPATCSERLFEYHVANTEYNNNRDSAQCARLVLAELS